MCKGKLTVKLIEYLGYKAGESLPPFKKRKTGEELVVAA